MSYPYTHQQNGMEEQKHRDIIEKGLALLAQLSMPVRFWDKVFLTTCNLINRLRSRVIDNETLLSRPFNTPTNYNKLRMFGCACWPNLRPYNSRKLSFWSQLYVFIGYNNLHKGYQCLHKAIGRVYISRDVIFDEAVFPFAIKSDNSS